ncbi:MAG: 50S ribosomal protein L18 [Actinobacteria bacterium]|nr:MAG: 50S ribosomal protein L18 [Actinomycetota bacterium]
MRPEAKRQARIRRHRRIRRKVSGTPTRPRLAVYRSNRHIYAQLVDDQAARTLAAVSDLGVEDGDKTAKAKKVGQAIAESARSLGVDRVVFDRSGRLYHGRVKAVAEAAREAGLSI